MFESTIGDLATKLGIEYAVAGAIVKLAKAKEVGKRMSPTGKGKPSTIYELPDVLTVDLNETETAMTINFPAELAVA